MFTKTYGLVKIVLLFIAILIPVLVIGCSGPPAAVFQASVSSGQAPLSITFTNESKNADEYIWDFGDGNTNTTAPGQSTITHIYEKTGTFTVTLTASKKVQPSQTNSTTAIVTVAPAPLDSVLLVPDQVVIGPKGTQAFKVEARDQFGNILTDIQLKFAATPNAGQIDSSGLFTAGIKAGQYENAVSVEVTQGNITRSATAKITVTNGTLDHVVLNPAAAELTAGKGQEFTATAFDVYGNPLSTDVKLTYKADSKSGQIDSTGVFTAGTKAGSYENAVTVEATQGTITKSTTARVTVTPGLPDHILVNPQTAELNIGKTQNFAATVFDIYDNPISNAQLACKCDSEAGTLTGTVFTAGNKANIFDKGITLTATAGSSSITRDVSITVKPDPPESIIFSVNQVSAGKTQQLKVDAKDKYGNQVSDIQATWTMGDVNAGSVSSSGMLTAGFVAGTFPDAIQVKVTQGDITKSVAGTVKIVPDQLDQVVVGPNQIDLGKGMTQQFVAVGADQYGNRIAGLSFSWSVTAGGGTIDQNGLLTASNTPGIYNKTVKAEARQGDLTRSGTATLTVEQDRIAFLSFRDDNTEVYIMDIDGKNVRSLTSTGTLKLGNISWSLDGRQLAFDEADLTNYTTSIIITGDQGNWANNLPATMDCAFPAWSPGGKRIAFSGWVDDNFEIFIADIDGSSLIRLTNNSYDDLAPAWSPDGTKIAFVSDRDGHEQIYLMNASGTGQTKLRTSPTSDVKPCWSPDGKQIVFQMDNGLVSVIALINIDGTGFTQLTPGSYDSGYPVWSPDGKKIIFHSYKDTADSPGIYIMESSGQNIIRLSPILTGSKVIEDVAPQLQPRKKGVPVNEDSILIPGAKSLKAMPVDQIVTQARKAVVRIETDLGTGSGFIIDSNGLIMTANHVISGAKQINVYLDDGTKYVATIKGKDMVRDIALLQINKTGLPFLKLGNLSQTSLGQPVVVLGYPLGSKELTVTTGIASSIRQDTSRNITWIQTDSAINPGNSGGPMLNMQGEVIGVVAMKFVGYGIEGVGFAISTNTVDIYLARLQDGQIIY